MGSNMAAQSPSHHLARFSSYALRYQLDPAEVPTSFLQSHILKYIGMLRSEIDKDTAQEIVAKVVEACQMEDGPGIARAYQRIVSGLPFNAQRRVIVDAIDMMRVRRLMRNSDTLVRLAAASIGLEAIPDNTVRSVAAYLARSQEDLDRAVRFFYMAIGRIPCGAFTELVCVTHAKGRSDLAREVVHFMARHNIKVRGTSDLLVHIRRFCAHPDKKSLAMTLLPVIGADAERRTIEVLLAWEFVHLSGILSGKLNGSASGLSAVVERNYFANNARLQNKVLEKLVEELEEVELEDDTQPWQGEEIDIALGIFHDMHRVGMRPSSHVMKNFLTFAEQHSLEHYSALSVYLFHTSFPQYHSVFFGALEGNGPVADDDAAHANRDFHLRGAAASLETALGLAVNAGDLSLAMSTLEERASLPYHIPYDLFECLLDPLLDRVPTPSTRRHVRRLLDLYESRGESRPASSFVLACFWYLVDDMQTLEDLENAASAARLMRHRKMRVKEKDMMALAKAAMKFRATSLLEKRPVHEETWGGRHWGMMQSISEREGFVMSELQRGEGLGEPLIEPLAPPTFP